ncbi:hypothetical protein PBY51_024583 [Eleginops maclovinus]|nr:hypothetical protein PBY51_024583 [Eleginops maclovinus]
MLGPQRKILKWDTGLEDTWRPRDKFILQQISLNSGPLLDLYSPRGAENGDHTDSNKASSFTRETDVTYQTNQTDR